MLEWIVKLAVLGAAAVLTLVGASALACVVPPQSLYLQHSELVRRTDRIVLAEMVHAEVLTEAGVRPDFQVGRSTHTETPKSFVRYFFDTTEVLKGSVGIRFTFDVFYPGPSAEELDLGTLAQMADRDFQGHLAARFWQPDGGRIPGYLDCNVYPAFRPGATYLLFLDEPYHLKGFEQILSLNDSWLAAVRFLLVNPDAQSGRSMHILEFVGQQPAAQVVVAERCLGDCDTRISLRVDQHLWGQHIEGEFLDDRPDWLRSPAEDAVVGGRYLAIYDGIDPLLEDYWAPFSLVPIEGGHVDFGPYTADSEIQFLGDLMIPLSEVLE